MFVLFEMCGCCVWCFMVCFVLVVINYAVCVGLLRLGMCCCCFCVLSAVCFVFLWFAFVLWLMFCLFCEGRVVCVVC